MITEKQLRQMRGAMTDDGVLNVLSNQDSDFGTFAKNVQRDDPNIPSKYIINHYLYGNSRGIPSPDAPAIKNFSPEKSMKETGEIARASWLERSFSRFADSFASTPERLLRGFGSREIREGREETSKGFDLSDLPGDIADVVGPSLPVIGGMVGGMAGALGGPLGAIAGAGAGAGAMEGGRQAIGRVFGVSERFSGEPGTAAQPEQLKSIAKEAILGASGEIGARAITSGAKILKPMLLKAGAVLTNVDDKVLGRAFENPRVMTQAIQWVKENMKQPFFQVAKRVSDRLIEMRKSAKEGFRTAKDELKKVLPNALFDISSSIDDAALVFKDFNINLGIKGGNVILKQGAAEPFSPSEMAEFQSLIVRVAKAKNYSIDDILDIHSAFRRAYDAIPLSDLKEPKMYHALLMKLKQAVDKGVSAILPDTMKQAYSQLALTARLKDLVGRKILTKVGGKTVMSENAESFFASLARMNRGQRREFISELSEAMGFDIAEMVQYLDDAQRLLHIFPETGSRTVDILRSVITSTIGYGVGGPIGALAAAAITSPKGIGAAVRGLGAASKSDLGKAAARAIINRASQPLLE